MAIVIKTGSIRKDGKYFLNATCECGKDFVMPQEQRKTRKSCGCKRFGGRRVHGQCRSAGKKEGGAYVSWRAMRERCNNPGNKMYSRYGGRGITVCERWEDFQNFLADMPPKPEGTTLERIDSDKGYEPSNCRWATRKDQNRNKSSSRMLTIYGKTMCIAEWCDISGESQSNVNARLNRLGWTHKEAVFGKPKE